MIELSEGSHEEDKMPAKQRTDAAGKPIDRNDDMKLEVVDDDNETTRLGLDNALRNADAGDENEKVTRDR